MQNGKLLDIEVYLFGNSLLGSCNENCRQKKLQTFQENNSAQIRQMQLSLDNCHHKHKLLTNLPLSPIYMRKPLQNSTANSISKHGTKL